MLAVTRFSFMGRHYHVTVEAATSKVLARFALNGSYPGLSKIVAMEYTLSGPMDMWLQNVAILLLSKAHADQIAPSPIEVDDLVRLLRMLPIES